MINNPISSDLIRGHIDTIVLHSLSKNDMHAQQISDFIEEKSNNQYKINQATLYSSLKRLENLKFVSSYYNDSDNGRRKYFHILDKGLEFANNNLSAWSESKSIIDKLMDIEPEKVVYVTHNDTQNNQVKPSEIVDIVSKPVVEEKPNDSSVNSNVVSTENSNNTTPNSTTDNNESVVMPVSEETKEINFRAILNSLIKAPDKTEEVVSEDTAGPEPLNIVISETESPASKMKFNETISVTDYNAKKTNNDGKIDFGDLTIKAEKEGYKVRISSKEASRSNGFVYVNKLKFFSSFVVMFIALIEFALFKTFTPYIFTKTNSIVALSIILFFPLFRLIVLIAKKNKKITKKYTLDAILVCAIVLFNLILVNLAVLFILNVELKVQFNLVSYFIVPLCVYVDTLLYYVFRNSISKAKKISSH